MLAIWMFPLEMTVGPGHHWDIEMPMGSRILTVEVHSGVPCLSAVVDSEQPIKSRRIQAYGVGDVIDGQDCPTYWDGAGPLVRIPGDYIGRFQLDGEGTFHVFEYKDQAY